MPLTDTDLIELLLKAADALNEEAAWCIDVDVDDRGVQRPSIPARDREFFEAVGEQAEGLRDLVGMIRERQRGEGPMPAAEPPVPVGDTRHDERGPADDR